MQQISQYCVIFLNKQQRGELELFEECKYVVQNRENTGTKIY